MKQDWRMELIPSDLDEPYATLLENFGLEIMFKIINLFEGEQIYFSKLENACNAKRKELIRKEFDGYNYKYLADKYKLSIRWIRVICKDLLEKPKNVINKTEKR